MTGKQLKNSILQWAIQGKLVPQDPNDEPASVLFEKIRAEKARLVKEGKIKKDKKESIIYRGEDNSYYEKFADGKVVCIDDEIPFEIPQGWEWCRISHLFLHTSGKQQNYTNKGKGTPQRFITTSNLYWGRFVLDNVKVMNFTKEEIETCSATKGDLLVCEGGAGYGRSAIWDKDYDICLQNHIHRLRPYIDGICKYIYYFIYFLKESNQLASVGTAMPGLSANRLKKLLLPLPPLKEQEYIVDKLIKGKSLVERYGDIEEVLSELNVNLPINLRKSILQEAIQGKLVLQDPNDEPASILLQRIKEEKQRLVKEGKLKKKDIVDSLIFKGDDNKYYEQIGKSITEITEEIPFSIPDSWTWSRLSVVVKIIMGQSPDGNDVFEAEKEDNAYEFHQGKIYFTEKYISPSGKWCKNPPRIANIGSLLVCVRAPIGDVNITQRQVGIGRGLAAISSYVEIKTDFLYYWMLAHKKNLVDKGTGSTFKAITIDILKDLIIPIPPLAEQKRILGRIELLYDRIKGN